VLKRSTKILLGILSFWPFLFFILFFIGMFTMIGMSGPDEPPTASFGLMMAGYFITIVSIYGMMIYYIVNVFMNNKLPSGKKALWAALLFLGNMMVIPFYWYFYIWCEPKPAEEEAVPLTDEGGNAVIFCASCGTRHPFNTYACTACGKPLHAQAVQPSAATNYETIGTLIPYKNTSALLAYYAAVFSLIPGLGLVLGPVAVILGIYGLKDVRNKREDKGTVHAWAGIILGGLTTAANVTLAVMIIIGISG